ncbi:MAG: SDR family NAD(P)-dependent oxidoreductase [Dermatophilaceae bacterium]
MSTSKTILITGATAGIGRHAALHLASLGHHVIATGRKESALAELRERATQSGSRGRLSVLRLDVTDPASIAAVAREVSELTGGRGAWTCWSTTRATGSSRRSRRSRTRSSARSSIRTSSG